MGQSGTTVSVAEVGIASGILGYGVGYILAPKKYNLEELLTQKPDVFEKAVSKSALLKQPEAKKKSYKAIVKARISYQEALKNKQGAAKLSELMSSAHLDSAYKNIKEFKRILDVNLIGTYLCSKYVGRVMLEAKKGKIINIASTNAIDTYYPESCDYDASKAGVISLTHNFAREFAPFINVNCICPGWVKTAMNKDLSIDQIKAEKKKILLKRFAEPEEISKIVVFLSSSKASYINDSIIRVDGGKFNG